MKIPYLQCIEGSLVPTQLVSYRCQKTMIRHHRLQNKKKNATVCKYFQFIGGQNLSWCTLVPVFRKRKQPVPYLRWVKVSVSKGIRVNIPRENTETGLRVFSLSVLKTHLSNESGWLIPETLLTKNPQHRWAPSQHNKVRGHDVQQRKGGKTYPGNGDSRKRTGFLSKRIKK